MKTEMTDTGWKEITTVKINLNKPNFPTKIFSTAGEWVSMQKKRPMLNNGGRNHCQCCSVKWSGIYTGAATYLLFTDKGNKVVCQDCYETLKRKLNKQ